MHQAAKPAGTSCSNLPKLLALLPSDDIAVVPKNPLPKLASHPTPVPLLSVKGNQNFVVSNPEKVGLVPAAMSLVAPDKFLNAPFIPK